MNIEVLLILLFILLLSFDTTNFLQSLISQPLFSCIIIGAFIDQIEVSIQIGFIAQLLSLSYIPVGGAKLPDFQMGSNILLLHFIQGGVTLEVIGDYLPIMIMISLFFMVLIQIERKIATKYMIFVEYENLDFNKLISYSFISHTLIFGFGISVIYILLHTIDFSYLRLLSGEKFYFYMVTFSLGALIVKYFKLGFKI